MSISVSITPAELAAQLEPVPNSSLVQRTLSGGDAFAGWAGFPGGATVVVGPQDSVGLNSELERVRMETPTTGHWHLHAEVYFIDEHGTQTGHAGTIDKNLTPAIDLSGVAP